MSIELLDLNSSGIKFHSLGATTANPLSPYVFSLAFEVGKKKQPSRINFEYNPIQMLQIGFQLLHFLDT